MASWPGTLPQTLQQRGFAYQPRPGVVRTGMDSGPDFVRRRFTAVSKDVQGVVTLTAAQIATLEGFFSTTLGEGADAFDWTHPLTGAAASMRFRAPPQVGEPEGTLYPVTLSLEILP